MWHSTASLEQTCGTAAPGCVLGFGFLLREPKLPSAACCVESERSWQNEKNLGHSRTAALMVKVLAKIAAGKGVQAIAARLLPQWNPVR